MNTEQGWLLNPQFSRGGGIFPAQEDFPWLTSTVCPTSSRGTAGPWQGWHGLEIQQCAQRVLCHKTPEKFSRKQRWHKELRLPEHQMLVTASASPAQGPQQPQQLPFTQG